MRTPASAEDPLDARFDPAPLLVFLAATAYFSLGVWGRDLWTTGEHRYAEVARGLVTPGHDGLVPHLNGALYPDKPPGWFWVAGAAHRLFGLDLALAARIPSIVGGACCVALVFSLGRRWYGRAGGLVAAGVLATADLFDWPSRYAHLDAFLTATVVLALYCYVRAEETPVQAPLRRVAWSALGYLAVGAGILIKGPAAVLIPGIVVAAFLLWTAPRRLATTTLVWGAFLALLPGLLWLWPASQRAGGDYVHSMLVGHAIGHAAGAVDKLQPWHFYLWTLPLGFLPWTVLLPAAAASAAKGSRSDERRIDRFLLVWLVAPTVLFSFSPAKRDLYLLAVLPAAALLCARLFHYLERGTHPDTRWTRWPRRIVAGAAVAIGTVLGILALAGIVRGREGFGIAPTAEARYFGDAFSAGRLLLAGSIGVAAAVAGVLAWRARSAVRAASCLIAAALCILALQALVILPARDPDQSVRPFLEEVRTRIGRAPLGRLGRDGGLQYAVNWVLDRDRVPEYANAHAAEWFLSAGAEPRFLVTDSKELERLGRPAEAVTLLVRRRRRSPDLHLLGNGAAAVSEAEPVGGR